MLELEAFLKPSEDLDMKQTLDTRLKRVLKKRCFAYFLIVVSGGFAALVFGSGSFSICVRSVCVVARSVMD